ncbi:MAG TPA: hypothetical protein VJZ00_25320 [Thermoanaerobaculia bacterium]|nr:hypothetical protein [Thermoanaerobaculia bacterium]
MRFGLVMLLVALVLIAAPAFACESCVSHFDSQTMRFCKYCQYDYCGYYQCQITYAYNGWEFCDGGWEDEDGYDGCFTDEGVAKNRCGPDQQDSRVGAVTPPRVEWRLAKVTIDARGRRS